MAPMHAWMLQLKQKFKIVDEHIKVGVNPKRKQIYHLIPFLVHDKLGYGAPLLFGEDVSPQIQTT